MILLPAIDLYEGKVVRLTKGDFDSSVDYGLDPCETAKRFRDMGCKNLHIVDLEGAKMGEPKHLTELSAISELGFSIEYGGGLRSKKAIRDALDAGAKRVMTGSILFKRPDMPEELFAEFGHGIMPSIDVRDGRVVHSGWLEQTEITPSECLESLFSVGCRTFLVTGVERDGMLAGPDFELYKPLVSIAAGIVAAGGVTTTEDIIKLKKIGVYGAVVGKALYEKNFDLKEALRISEEE